MLINEGEPIVGSGLAKTLLSNELSSYDICWVGVWEETDEGPSRLMPVELYTQTSAGLCSSWRDPNRVSRL